MSNVQVCSGNPDIFSGSLCYDFPTDRAVAATPYNEGTYLVNLTGPGASSVSNDELSYQLRNKKKLTFPFQIVQADSTLTRLFLAAPDIPSLHNLQITFTSNAKLLVKVQLCDTRKKPLTFCVDWVPLTTPVACVTEIISSFCEIQRLSQDKNPTRYYVTTNTSQDKIPFWLHTSNLIESDDTYRAFKVTVKGRKQMCLYCSSLDHPWYKCPNKNQVKKERKRLHEERMKKKPEAVPKATPQAPPKPTPKKSPKPPPKDSQGAIPKVLPQAQPKPPNKDPPDAPPKVPPQATAKPSPKDPPKTTTTWLDDEVEFRTITKKFRKNSLGNMAEKETPRSTVETSPFSEAQSISPIQPPAKVQIPTDLTPEKYQGPYWGQEYFPGRAYHTQEEFLEIIQSCKQCYLLFELYENPYKCKTYPNCTVPDVFIFPKNA